MFQYVHHIHYLVHDCQAMVEYFEKTFGMRPDHQGCYKERGVKEAQYNVGPTQIQICEPLDPNSRDAQYLAKHGPGVDHVAWAVNDIGTVAQELAARGANVRQKKGVANRSHSNQTLNIERASSHGVWFQLAEGSIKKRGEE